MLISQNSKCDVAMSGFPELGLKLDPNSKPACFNLTESNTSGAHGFQKFNSGWAWLGFENTPTRSLVNIRRMYATI